MGKNCVLHPSGPVELIQTSLIQTILGFVFGEIYCPLFCSFQTQRGYTCHVISLVKHYCFFSRIIIHYIVFDTLITLMNKPQLYSNHTKKSVNNKQSLGDNIGHHNSHLILRIKLILTECQPCCDRKITVQPHVQLRKKETTRFMVGLAHSGPNPTRAGHVSSSSNGAALTPPASDEASKNTRTSS